MRQRIALEAREFSAVLFDIDGTLIDSNGAHADTWVQALRENGVSADLHAVRRLIGMGGDKLLPIIAHIEETSPRGKAIAARKKELFGDRLPGLVPTPGARRLVQFLKDRGIDLIIATSADDREMSALLKQAGVDDLFPQRASKDDASDSKPDPDIVQAALEQAGARADETVMVGDTPYDIEAATRAGVKTVALRSGGFWTDDDLAAAFAIYDHPADLLHQLDGAE